MYRFLQSQSIFTLLSLLFLSSPMTAQDLIEKVRTGTLEKKINVAPNKMGQKIQQLKQDNFSVQKNLFSVTTSTTLLNKVKNTVSDAVFLEVNQNELAQIHQRKADQLLLSVPVTNDKSVALKLAKTKVITDTYRMETSDGRFFDFGENQGVFYQGIIQGNPNSLVAVSIFPNHVRALIIDDNGQYVLGKMQDKSEQYILYNDKNLQIPNGFSCGTQDHHNLTKDIPTINDNTSLKAPGDCVEVYVECDFAMYNSHGDNVGNVNAYVTSLMNETSILYTNENIAIVLSDSFVWTSADPYTASNNTGDVLELFGEFRKNAYNGRLAHLISTRSLGGGVAWLDVLCNSYYTFNADFDEDGTAELHHAGPYAVSASMSTSITAVPTFSWNVEVFTHEMGHNMGSPHTQSCSWTGGPIDNCVAVEDGTCSPGPAPTNGGTIMSYCHLTGVGINFNNGFGTQPGDLIRNRYNNANCLSPCNDDGCTDNTACNYNASAVNDDGSCEYLSCQGCTDNLACNYDASATQDDGSCNYTCYCTSTGTNTGDEWIQNVNFNTINNTTAADGGYGDYTSIVTNVDISQTYALTLTPGFAGTAYNERWFVYMDWNQNFVFEASELVYQSPNPSNTVVTTNITVPASATLGNTGMRVIMTWESNPVTDACSTFEYGEVEDYTINIVSPATGCTDPCSANYDASAATDDGSCTAQLLGCTDMNACNYDATALCDDSSCSNADPMTGNTNICSGDTEVWNATTCTYDIDVVQVLGCTTVTACNYNASANCNDGSCSNADPMTGNTNICSGDTEVWNATTCTYDIDVVQVLGCTTVTACNYNASANCDDASCAFAPDASFNTINPSYCTSDAPITLVPTTSGGAFTGSGVSGNTFDPLSVSVGSTSTITYTVGSPGCTNTSSQQTVVNACMDAGLTLSLKVLLEGAHDASTGGMHTKLRQKNLIPTTQPYNTAPWNYTGVESSTNLPTDMVDWVLVEIREGTPSLIGSASTTMVETVAGILLSNGDIVATDGVSPLTFNQLSIGVNYHILVRHRNHLDIISATTIVGATNMLYDFTLNVGMAFGNSQQKQINGKGCMYAADYTIDGIIQISDFSLWNTDPAILNTYDATDGNMDGTVQTTDYDIWIPNSAKVGIIETKP